MAKVTLTLSSNDLEADDMEEALETLRPIVEYMVVGKVTIKIEEE